VVTVWRECDGGVSAEPPIEGSPTAASKGSRDYPKAIERRDTIKNDTDERKRCDDGVFFACGAPIEGSPTAASKGYFSKDPPGSWIRYIPGSKLHDYSGVFGVSGYGGARIISHYRERGGQSKGTYHGCVLYRGIDTMDILFDDRIIQRAIPHDWVLKVLIESTFSMRKPRSYVHPKWDSQACSWPDDPALPSATRFASADEQKYREDRERLHGAVPEQGLESLQPGDRVEVWRKADSVGFIKGKITQTKSGRWCPAKFGGPSRNRPGRYTVQMYYSPRFGEWLREEELPTV